jgi:hypothetical protein
MFSFLFLSDPFGYPVELAARAFDPVLHLLLLLAVHLRQRFVDASAGASQDGRSHLEIALQRGSLCGGLR